MQPELLTFARTLLLTATVGLVACSDGGGEAELGLERSAIVYGELSDEMDDEVVQLSGRVSDDFTLSCTGTLIAPNIVLTALHCVAFNDPSAPFRCEPDGTLTSTAPGGGILAETIPGEGVEVYFGATRGAEQAPGVRVFGSGSTNVCRGDIAAVVLDGDLGQDIAPIRLGRSVRLGESMRIVGFGQAEVPGPGDRRFRAGLRVLDVGAVGDDPGTGTTAPNTFVLGEGPCHGDSGGPALSEETGAVTGVYSLSSGASCTAAGVRNAFTLVSSYEDVVRRAFEFAGGEPLIEEGGGGTGGTTTSGGSGGGGTLGEGSGSREDTSCACRTTGRRSSAAYDLLGLVLAMFSAVRRRTRGRKAA